MSWKVINPSLLPQEVIDFLQPELLAEALLLCLIGAAIGMSLSTTIAHSLPPQFPPIKPDARVWWFVTATVLGLALAVGLPPALRAKRMKIVDALAGR